MHAKQGISIQELHFKIDYLMMQLEQVENKVIRKNEALIDNHLFLCQAKLSESKKKMHQIGDLLAHAARGADPYQSGRLESILFGGETGNVCKKSIKKQKIQLLS